MADYDSGEVTDRERLAADRQKEIAKFNADAVKNQLSRQIANYDLANQQNRKLADVQLKQNSQKSEADRFEAQRNLQNAALGLLGSMGNTALNSSTTKNFMTMLEDRNDADNQTYWNQLQTNNNTVNNAYNESYNQNQVAKNDAAANAEKALRDIESDLSANLSNINPNLYVKPGVDDARMYSDWTYNENKVNPNLATLSGYIMPQNATTQDTRKVSGRNQLQGNDYFSRLVNNNNRR